MNKIRTGIVRLQKSGPQNGLLDFIFQWKFGGHSFARRERSSAGKWLRRELADEDGDSHFLSAIDGEADFVFAGFWDLEAGYAHDNGRAGGGSAGGDLNVDLLGRRRGLEFFAVGIDEGKFYFFETFFNFLETKLADDMTTDGNGELGDKDHVSSAKDI
jgi:hypothetical protein